ncbi:MULTISPECIES: hypothetical protein [unclassified Tardiphaga]|uniref:hypothetical protein n=1 Tax=unclassified Tardiphaga TaxID=2631404 RepID=UPI001FEFA574|nr:MULTISPECIES: hypothetical protein [unclassified Tardiphaga]
MADAAEFHEIAGPGTPAHRQDTLWWLAAVTLAVVLAVPFFLVDVPPVLDYPNHLARYFVLAHPDDPVLSQIYAPAWRVLPNLAFDVLGAELLKVVPVHVGGRMLLALSLYAPVIGVIVFSRVAFGRFLYWPLASGVIAYNGIFHLGFMNFLLSLGLALVAAAGWLALRRRGSVAVTALVGAVSVAIIFFSHIFGVVLFALMLAGLELTRLFDLRRSGRLDTSQVLQTVGLAAAVLVPLVGLYLPSPVSQGLLLGDWGGIDKIGALLMPFATYSMAVTAITAVAVLILLVLNRQYFEIAPGIGLVMIALLLIYAAAPITVGRGSFVDSRLCVMLAFVGFAGAAPRMTSQRAVVAAVVLATLIGARSAYISWVWIDHRHDVAELRSAIASVPSGARVLTARARPSVETAVGRPSRALASIFRLDGHLPALLLIERRAAWPLLFADNSQQPLIVKPAYAAIAQPLEEPVLWATLRRDSYTAKELEDAHYLPNWRSKFDYVLLTDLPADVMPLDGLSLVTKTSSAILYKVAAPPL